MHRTQAGKGADPGKGRGKGKAARSGAKGGQEPPHYDPSTPCGYYLAGHCRYGDACAKQHSVPYALAIRSEWLEPESQAAKDALRAAAEQTLGASGVRDADLFPRVFSQALSLQEGHFTEAAPWQPGGAVRRWGRARGPLRRPEDCDGDGFAWELGPEEQAAPSAPEEASASGTLARRSQHLRYLLVLDLEGKDEIIEFPVIALDTWELREVGRFQRFVRPQPLFDGCAQTPDSPAILFPAVLEEFGQWLCQTVGHGLKGVGGAHATTAFLTCGDWDCKHVHAQCRICSIPVPPAFRQWVNIKRSYSEAYGGDFRGMKSMLSRLKLLDRDGNVLHGFHHLGMHDVENISRCALHLLKDDGELRLNGGMR